MPPHLHPRSRMTTSLFTTTLMVSFLVVAAPHLIPCPVDPRTHADSPDATGQTRRRRRRSVAAGDTCSGVASDPDGHKMPLLDDPLAPRRECPVPKPGGLIARVLGLKGESTASTPIQQQPTREAQPKDHDHDQ
ncbi:hypothetical protein ACEQ8H_008713 [Pleosporales sp. CAS-2024a]